MRSDGRVDGIQGGCRKASPVILEPMMAVEVETPEEYMGDVMGDLSSRRGMAQGMDDIAGGGGKIIAPKSVVGNVRLLATSLRSLTQGRATYTMEFKHYSEAPMNVSEAIVNARAIPRDLRASHSMINVLFEGRRKMAKGKFERTKPHVMWARLVTLTMARPR